MAFAQATLRMCHTDSRCLIAARVGSPGQVFEGSGFCQWQSAGLHQCTVCWAIASIIRECTIVQQLLCANRQIYAVKDPHEMIAEIM